MGDRLKRHHADRHSIREIHSKERHTKGEKRDASKERHTKGDKRDTLQERNEPSSHQTGEPSRVKGPFHATNTLSRRSHITIVDVRKPSE